VWWHFESGVSFVFKSGVPSYSFLLQTKLLQSQDTYDLSAVDGFAATVAVNVLGVNSAMNPNIGPTQCRNLTMTPFNFSSPFPRACSCPDMLRLDSDGAVAGPLSMAVACLSPCQFSTGTFLISGSSQTTAQNWTAYWNSVACPLGGHTGVTNNTFGVSCGTYMSNLVCCSCGSSGGICQANCGNAMQPLCTDANALPNPSCQFGCSPFAGYPVTQAWINSECNAVNWPPYPWGGVSVPLSQVPVVWQTCNPTVYSWQFADLTSTYTCVQPDYQITFC
jgi:hypothetical protein